MFPFQILSERKKIFKIHIKDTPLGKDISIDELAKRTDGYSGADIEAVVDTASMFAIRAYVDKYKGSDVLKAKLKELEITKKDFDDAMGKVKPYSKSDLGRRRANSA